MPTEQEVAVEVSKPTVLFNKNSPAILTYHKESDSGKSACVSIKRGITMGIGVVGYVDIAPFADAKKGDKFSVPSNYKTVEHYDENGEVMAHESGTPFNYFEW